MNRNLIDQAMHARQIFQSRTPAQRLSGARFEVKNLASDWAEIYLYGDIAWYDITAAMVAEALNNLSASTLSVRLNSMGGDVFDGVAIYNLLRNYANNHSATISMNVDALAASIASVIAMAGDEIVIAKNAQIMIHRAWAGCIGDAEDMQAMADVLESIENDMIIPTYQDRTGISSSDLAAMMKAETWMNAQTAVDKGFADRIAADNGAKALLRPGNYNKAPSGKAGLSIEHARAKTKMAELSLENILVSPREQTLIAGMRTRMAQLSAEQSPAEATEAARRQMAEIAREHR